MRNVRSASKLAGSLLLILGLCSPLEARANGWFDFGAGYPLVATPGVGDSANIGLASVALEGGFGFGIGRFTFGLGGGFRGYWAMNRAGDHNADIITLMVPLQVHVGYQTQRYMLPFILNLGVFARHYDGVDPWASGVSISGEVQWRFAVRRLGDHGGQQTGWMSRRGAFTVSPALEIGYTRDMNAELSDVQKYVFIVFWIKTGWARWLP